MYDIMIYEADPTWEKWVPNSRRELHSEHATMDPNVLRKMLRSLAQTCRSLRAVALPLLWCVVHIETIDQLGILRETLRVSPGIATLIRSSCFLWEMSLDRFVVCEPDPPEYGSLLDMAFRNRNEMWESFGRKHRCEMVLEDPEGAEQHDSDDEGRYYFDYQGACFLQPGPPPYAVPGYRRLTDTLKPVDGRKFLISGPDSKGEDRLIKSADQFHACMTEIVQQLSAVEVFGWAGSVTPMSLDTLEALSKLSTITPLSVSFSGGRGVVHACKSSFLFTRRMSSSPSAVSVPFWNLTRKLQELRVSDLTGPFPRPTPTAAENAMGEQHGEGFTSFEIPAVLPAAEAERRALHQSVACRMFIEAAKGGNLRCIGSNMRVDAIFAMRAMLPYWAVIDEWGLFTDATWVKAALSLRALLAHASLWLGTTLESVARYDRRLTRQEVQQLQSYFETTGTPVLVEVEEGESQPVERYLPWLAEDAELAQKVADAWNGVLERGGADLIKCRCDKCLDN